MYSICIVQYMYGPGQKPLKDRDRVEWPALEVTLPREWPIQRLTGPSQWQHQRSIPMLGPISILGGSQSWAIWSSILGTVQTGFFFRGGIKYDCTRRGIWPFWTISSKIGGSKKGKKKPSVRSLVYYCLVKSIAVVVSWIIMIIAIYPNNYI